MTSSQKLSNKEKRDTLITSNVNYLLFPVRLADVEEEFGMPTNPDYCSAVIGEIDGEEKILNVCGDRYNLRDNTLFVDIENALEANDINFKVKYEMTNHVVFTAKFVLYTMGGKDLAFQVGEGDKVYPQISVRKSYNGLVKYAFLFGFFRLVCKNGLTIPVAEMKDFNFNYVGKHTEKLDENIKHLRSRLDLYLDYVERNDVARRFLDLYDRKVENYADRVEEVMNATKISLSGSGLASKDYDGRGKNFDTVMDYIENEARSLNTEVNDWLIYNGLNSFIYKNNVKADEVRDKMDKDVMTYIIKNEPKELEEVTA